MKQFERLLTVLVVLLIIMSSVYAEDTAITNSNISVDDLFVNGTAQVVGRNNPTSGAGLELAYESDTGYILAYDRSGGAFKALDLASTTFRVRTGAGNVETLYGNNGAVGIGTTNPLHDLHIFKNGTMPDVKIESGTDHVELVLDSAADRNPTVSLLRNGSYKWQIYNHNSNDALLFEEKTSSSFPLALTQGGNVGIGTSSPTADLHVISSGNPGLLVESLTADALIDLDADNGTGDYAGIRFLKAGTIKHQIFLDDETSDDMIFYQNAGHDFVFSNGNVGIGTDSPAAKFNVVQGGDYNGGTVAAIFENGGSNRATIRLRTTSDTASELVFDVNNSLRWMWSARTSSDDYKLNLYPQGATPSYGSVSNAVLSILQNGNVGIGTDSPGTGLDIEMPSATLRIDATEGVGTDSTGIASLYLVNDADSVASVQIARSGNPIPGAMYIRDTNGIIIADTGGNVAIGAVTPASKLEVGGDVYIHDLTIASLGSDPLCWDGTGDGSKIGDCTSLREYKENIRDYNDGLDEVMLLRPRLYDWKNGSKNMVGFIADEVEESVLSLAKYNNGSLTGYKEFGMSALLVNAIKELKTENDLLKREICVINPSSEVCGS